MNEIDVLLSPHFTLREMVASSHRTIDNTANEVVIEQLKRLCTDYLEPIRKEFGPLLVSSGYRCPALNTAIGGSKASAHTFGCAADFMPADKSITVKDVVSWIRDYSRLPFDQVIDEATRTASWVHVGMVRPGFSPKPRGNVLAFRDGLYSPIA